MVPSIKISDFIGYLSESGSRHNLITVSEVDCHMVNRLLSDEASPPVRLEALLVALVNEGSMTIVIDSLPYTVEAGTFLTIAPVHVVQAHRPSLDFRAQLLAASYKDAPGMMPVRKRFNPMHIIRRPCNRLKPREIERLSASFGYIRSRIGLRSHSFRQEVIINAFEAFCLDIADILAGINALDPLMPFSRKEEILQQFIQLLLNNVRERHAVSFYADSLCITPQYLSLALKEMTGKSASLWIDEALIFEARALLKMPHITIQQIADRLNFSNQSTFGKFFKKNTGLSPLEYRKS
ncbi:MAG: AraC family transcriptional regulator [Tannerellaceae bacterium]|jgi:AraC-like DNA-binding protein|nr:AraC family transcriptional regulator [Tannerellaceae bacterium]